jgi:alginate O-acetyltransferase complex protein AlgI
VLFNSLEYAAFFIAVYALYRLISRYAQIGLGALLAASLIFYASWNPWYLLLIVNSTVVDFVLAHRLHRTADANRRRWLVSASVIYDLGILGIFKYADFFLTNAQGLAAHFASLGWIGPASADLLAARLDVVLPVGISFFTFQSMSYTIDVYRRQLDPVTAGLLPRRAHLGWRGQFDWLRAMFAEYRRYLLFVSFFPQLVAGPIVRARDLLPQLAARPKITDAMGARGLALIALGLIKKVAIADYLAVNLVDRTFGAPETVSSLEMLVGIYGYALQIYGDFSGYTDMAIGSALLLGFTFPDNFNAPYVARNLQQFWRRWHISLSSWLRDYLYIGLGGNRGGRWRTYRNLMLTMLLGGLWHGAGWNFIAWGALHGVALAVIRAVDRHRQGRPLLPKPLAIFFTFHYVCLAWIFFRCETFVEALEVLQSLAAGTWATTQLAAPAMAVLGVAAVAHFTPRDTFDRILGGFNRLPAFGQAVALVALAFSVQQLASADVLPFIYFQF